MPALRHHSRKHEETKNYIFWLYKFISDFFKFLTDHNHLQIRLVRHKSKTSESMIPIDSANLRKQEQQQHWDQLVAYHLTHTAPIFSCQLFFPSLVKNSAEQRKWLTKGSIFWLYIWLHFWKQRSKIILEVFEIAFPNMLSYIFFVIFKKCIVFFLTKESYKTEFKRLFCHCILVWFTFIMFKSFSCNKTKDRAPKQDWLELPHGSRLSSYPKTTHFRSNHRRNDNSIRALRSVRIVSL